MTNIEQREHQITQIVTYGELSNKRLSVVG